MMHFVIPAIGLNNTQMSLKQGKQIGDKELSSQAFPRAKTLVFTSKMVYFSVP